VYCKKEVCKQQFVYMWSLISKRRLKRGAWNTRMVDRRGTYRVLVGRSERRRLHERPRCRWEDNIKIYVPEVRWGDLDSIKLTKDRDSWQALVNGVMNFRLA
jgi:hypothetical protein